MQLSVIIPAYNEENRLSRTLKDIDKYLKKQDYHYEILVVDDGSSDSTAKLAQKMAEKINNLKVISYKKNKGKGHAVRQGVLQSRGEYCLFMDADNSIGINQIEKFWPEIDRGYKIVIASRILKGAKTDYPQTWLWRIVVTRGLNALRKAIFNLREIEDTQCGFKCFKKEAANYVFSESKVNGFAFDIEILILAYKREAKVKEVPVYWRNCPGSRVNLLSLAKTLPELPKIKRL